MPGLPRAAITAGKAHWLLDLNLGGRLYHVAVDAVDLTTADGGTLSYVPGLDALEVTVGRAAQSVSVRVSALEDWALLVARGLDLSSGTATLRRAYEGQTWEQTRVFATGKVLDPSYGSKFEPLEFSIQSRVASQPYPDPDLVIDSRTWPITVSPFKLVPSKNVQGAVYPTIFGKPGYGSGPVLWNTIQLSIAGSPAYCAEYGAGAHTYRSTKTIIAGHTLQATSVTVIDVSAEYGHVRPDTDRVVKETIPVAYTNDLLGNKVAYLDLTSTKKVHIFPDSEYWVHWDNGGGLLRPDGSGLLRGAGEIIAYLLERSGLPVARGKVEAARSRLDRYLLDVAIVESVDVESWIEDMVGTCVPICRRENGDGVWYEVIPYDATPADAEMHLVAEQYDGFPVGARSAGVPVARTGSVAYGKLDGVCNEITLEWAPERGDKPTRRILITGTDVAPSDTVIPSAFCLVSRAKYGERKKVFKALAVHDEPTAKLMAQDLARRYALPRRTIEYAGGLELDALNVNSVVTLTDTDLHLTEELCIVREITLSLTGASVILELIDLPVYRQRST